jgi:hypothetical protein
MKIVVIAIVIVGVLAYYNIDLRAILEKIITSSLFQSIWAFIKNIWFDYLVPIWVFIKENIAGFFSI